MSNVVKLPKKKKLEIDNWKAAIDELSHKLSDRLYDQIWLTSGEADDEDMPEDIADCMIVGVLASMLVTITHERNVLGPDILLKLIEYEIGEHEKK